ncbi:MAG: DUF3280 domain-containing protein [Hyphomicrobium sp.]|nr:DUF3280 domain-containing protein [Hyphomicrobium sp.]
MENVCRIHRAAWVVASLLAWAACAWAEGPPQTIAVLPFEIHDTSGEVGSPTRHDAMLAALTRLVGEKIEASGLYRVVPQPRVDSAVASVNSGTFLRSCNGCEIDIARRAGADAVLIGWFWKVSTLIGSLHIEIKDVASGRTVYARVFDFRGDNEKAWQRAAEYMVGTLSNARRGAASPSQGQ